MTYAEQRRTAKRLRHDAELLRTYREHVPGLRFDMKIWGWHGPSHKPVNDDHCGTRACAIGTIALSGKSGIKGVWEPSYRYDGPVNRGLHVGYDLCFTLPGSRMVKISGEHAAMNYYNITYTEARDLTDGGSNNARAKANEMDALAETYEQRAMLAEVAESVT